MLSFEADTGNKLVYPFPLNHGVPSFQTWQSLRQFALNYPKHRNDTASQLWSERGLVIARDEEDESWTSRRYPHDMTSILERIWIMISWLATYTSVLTLYVAADDISRACGEQFPLIGKQLPWLQDIFSNLRIIYCIQIAYLSQVPCSSRSDSFTSWK